MVKQTILEHELEQLFDIRHSKSRDERVLNDAAMVAQREIRLITRMFSDGIPDVSIPLGDTEKLNWDAKTKSLLLISEESSQLIITASKQTMIRVRPHLTSLVIAAREFYRHD